MSSTHFAEWQAFESLEPFVPRRLDLLFAHLIWQTAAIMLGKAPEHPIEKFTLEYGVDIDPVVEVEKAIKKQEAGRENFLHSMREMMRAYGGKVVRANRD